MNKKYIPSALILYLNYFIHGVGCSILGQAVIKEALAASWGVEVMAITAISAALGLGRLIALPFAGPLSDKLGRRISTAIGSGSYAIYLIFRTNCVEAEETQIRAEIDKLAENYHRIVEYGKMRTCFSCLQSAPDPCVQTLRDIYKKDLTEIIVEETVEDGALYKEVQTYLETEMPDELPLLRAYTDPSYPLVKCYNLEGAIREARQERVWMKSGAYLVIQPTEALTVIDVNSGKCLKKNSHFPEINREAAREAVRQIRLRNISGIIIIDFINMKSAEEKKELLAYLQLELKKDPHPGNVIGMTKLQLVEITRKKIRKTLEESLHG